MTLKNVITFLTAGLLLAQTPCPAMGARSNGQREILVAAASNLTAVAHSLGSQFARASGVRVVFSFGSTAQLARQIENGAPFDAFLAADTEHVQELERKSILLPHSAAVYANGILALWVPRASLPVNRLEDLAGPEIHVIAVANPQLAPYGAATMQALKRAGILETVQPKIVYAENINMARQYGITGNADAVFTAWSLVKDTGHVVPVDEKLHDPIAQELGVVAASAHRDDAQRFTAFVLGPAGREILRAAGYGLPR